MKWFSVTVAIALAGVVDAQTLTMTKDQVVTIRACVQSGADNGSVVLNRVFEVRGDQLIGQTLGTPVVYWLNDSRPLRPHIGQMVDVTGKIKGTERSEANVQRLADGSIQVELEGPGNDVETTLDAVPEVLGTSGSLDDVQTRLIKLDVQTVTLFRGTCQAGSAPAEVVDYYTQED